MAQKYFREMGNFGQYVLRHQSRWFQSITILGFCFAYLKVFDRFETIASLDAYQITKYQFFKNLSFFVAWFSKNSRKSFWIRNFRANCLSRRDQKVYSIFQNRAPWGTIFLFKRFHGERKCLSRFLIMTTNSFRIPIVQKFENIFTHIFFIFFCIGIYSLFRSINKIHDDKRSLEQVYSFHANANIKAKFIFFKKCIHKWKHS